jgi:hypothetical protein
MIGQKTLYFIIIVLVVFIIVYLTKFNTCNVYSGWGRNERCTCLGKLEKKDLTPLAMDQDVVEKCFGLIIDKRYGYEPVLDR